MRCADKIAKTLYQSGVRHAFGMPGGEVIVLIDALANAGIDFVFARNETAAAIMAAGTCAEGTRPGLLVTTIGPGLANAMNGIADAVQERVPLIVLSGTIEDQLLGRYTHQVVDHKQLLAPLVKASFDLAAETASAVVARAIRLAMSHPCGPVHIDISPTLAAMPSLEHRVAPFINACAPSMDSSSRLVHEVRGRLASAKKPIILAGFDSVRGHQSVLLSDLLEAANIPVLTTYKAKGVIDEAHALSVGAAGLSPRADALILPLLRSADLILLVGYDPIEMRAGWLDFVDSPDRLIDIGPSYDHAMHHAGTRILADPVSFLEAVLEGMHVSSVWTSGEPQEVRRALHDFPARSDWGPLAVFETLQRELPSNAVLSVDSGAHRILLSQIWQCNGPYGLVQSVGWCTMGSAIPLAVGRKLSMPERPVIAVLGDGGLEMTMGELGTIRDQQLPIIIVVIQDQSLELIGIKQDQTHLQRRAVEFGTTNYADVAKSFGGHGVNVKSTHALRAAISDALNRSEFTLISCCISSRSYTGLI